MNNENELNPQDKRDISIKQGNYNESIKGNYIETILKKKFINISKLFFFIIVCSFSLYISQKVNINGNNNDVIFSPNNNLTIGGVPEDSYKEEIELRIEAEKQAEKAKEQVEQIIRDGNLDITEERLLEEIEFAQKKGGGSRTPLSTSLRADS